MKYNHDGGSVEIDCARSTAGRARISVRDSGLGLPPEKIELLFTPFQRLGAERTAVPGAGLGLNAGK